METLPPMQLFVSLVGTLAVYTALADYTITPLHGIVPPECPTGLSGITYLGDDTYAVIEDSGARLYYLTLPIDPASGLANTNAIAFSPPYALQGSDLESIAFDRAHNSLYVSDESDASIREFSVHNNDLLATLPLPQNLRHAQPNLSLESLSLHPNGLTLWTSNEEHTTLDPAPYVRLTQCTRPNSSTPWQPSAQFAYPVDPATGSPFRGRLYSGIADLEALPDDSLLILERECSIKNQRLPLPSFRIRIYHVRLTDATNVLPLDSLQAETDDFQPVSKTLLHAIDGPMSLSNYEGLCLGPTLHDGSRTLLLIADSDAGALPAISILRLNEK